jgi:nitrate reductase gamma subunit
MIALTILGYIAVLVFIVGMAARAAHFANTPVHLRWELYPVPHEAPHRARYGGSYMEEVDWWSKEHETSTVNELWEMGTEIVFLRALWHHNRKLWFVSFPFHFGLYLLMTFVALLLLGGFLGAVGLELPEIAAFLLVLATALCGFGGFALGGIGTFGLIVRRLTDEELKDYTGPIDLLNLVWFFLLFGLGVAALGLDPDASQLRGYIQGLFTFSAPEGMGILTVVAVVLANLMVIYIPFTHMSHMVAKYFTYHSVRWNDEALEPGGALDKKLQEQLAYPVTWSAEHIGADGTRTWADVATTNPWEESGK